MEPAPREVLLGWLRERGRAVLAGNREYFDCLDFVPPDRFVRHGGDSLANTEEYRHDVDEDEAYRLLLAYWRAEAGRFGGPGLATEDDVAQYVLAREQSTPPSSRRDYL